MYKPRPNTWAPPSWPVLVALALVTLLMVGIVGIDLFLERRVADQTDDLIGNAQRATELLDDMRIRVRHLLSAPRDGREMTRINLEIARDARDYDPLATFPGERQGWANLQGLLQALPTVPSDAPLTRSDLVAESNRSLDGLIAINHRKARAIAEQIRAAHHGALWGDTVVGGSTLALVLLIAVTLIRVLARQRRLIAERVRLLDEKNSELEAFAARAAHDLRGPLNPVRGYADLILEAQGLPDGVPLMAQRIRRSVDRMTGVIDGMLALSTSGRPPPGKSSPAALVAAVVEEMGPELHGVEVVTRLSGGSAACHEGALGQILRNVIGNASKFRSPARSPKITIETRDLGSIIEITVEDNGLGMDSESAAHAFEPFYRAHSSRTVPGHGLGLAIVERTVRSLGGTSTLSSTVDRGTRVVIRLPRS